jgi:hypothetical protein
MAPKCKSSDAGNSHETKGTHRILPLSESSQKGKGKKSYAEVVKI